MEGTKTLLTQKTCGRWGKRGDMANWFEES